MSRGIRGRLDRLEQGRPTADPNKPPPYFWDVISGAKNAEDLPAADRARLEEWWEVRREESKGCRIAAVRRLVEMMRTDCAPPGVPVPTAEELVKREVRERGFCVIEELLRLIPSPQEAGL
jgi:hypothetical protein